MSLRSSTVDGHSNSIYTKGSVLVLNWGAHFSSLIVLLKPDVQIIVVTTKFTFFIEVDSLQGCGAFCEILIKYGLELEFLKIVWNFTWNLLLCWFQTSKFHEIQSVFDKLVIWALYGYLYHEWVGWTFLHARTLFHGGFLFKGHMIQIS